MAVKIQFRGDTAANWSSANPILMEREMGINTDDGTYKLGDGTTAWNSLAYGGVTGPTGADGSQLTAGSGAPSGGADGDFYIRTSNLHFYKKITGTWTDQGNLFGSVAKGDVLYGDATDSISKVGIGGFGTVWRVSNTGIPEWVDILDPKFGFFLKEDFQTNIGGQMSTGMSVSGAASGVASRNDLQTATNVGIYEIQTGTAGATDGSYIGWSTSNHNMIFSNGPVVFKTCLQLSRLSTALQEYYMRIGFFDDTSLVDATVDGAYIVYERAVTGAFWVGVTVNNSTRSTFTSAVAPVINTFTYFKIAVNSAGTLVDFLIDGASIGTLSTNIPTGTGRGTGCMVGIHKQVGTGTNTSVPIDYMYVSKIYDTPRGY